MRRACLNGAKHVTIIQRFVRLLMRDNPHLDGGKVFEALRQAGVGIVKDLWLEADAVVRIVKRVG